MKKTKIVATISDKKCSKEFIEDLFTNGLNVVRLNTAHQSTNDALKVINVVREVSDKIAILIDTKGPEIRTNGCGEGLSYKKDQEIKIKGDPDTPSTIDCINVNYSGFVNEIKPGSKILIDDGYIILSVIGKEDDYLRCKFETDAVIQSRKSVNVPNVEFGLPSLNDKDREFIQFAIEQDIDFIAHSFVRNKEDAMAVQELLDAKKSPIKIIAKIENQKGVDNIDEILDHVYGIMVARGDLSVEIPYEKTPVVQKQLIKKCIDRRKPVIIATQMLHSMINNPRPTRAEVSDIAGAVYSNADALMLSGETAFGKYPVEAISTMKKIALEIEKSKTGFLDLETVVLHCEISSVLTKSAIETSERLDVSAIIADTISGRTARNLSGYRSSKPVFAICYSKHAMRELAMVYGVFPYFMKRSNTSHEFLQQSLNQLIIEDKLSNNDLLIILAGNFGIHQGASYIEVGTVQDMLEIE